MKSVVLVVVGSMVLGGCTGPGMKLSSKGQFYNLESSSTGALDPSLKTLITFACVPEEGRYESVKVDEELAECHGRFVVLDKNQAQQTGYLTGVFAAALQSGAFVGGMYLLGDGIGDSGSKTTNNNDLRGETTSSSLGVGGQGGSAMSASQGGAGGTGYGYGGKGGSVNNGYKHRR